MVFTRTVLSTLALSFCPTEQCLLSHCFPLCPSVRLSFYTWYSLEQCCPPPLALSFCSTAQCLFSHCFSLCPSVLLYMVFTRTVLSTLALSFCSIAQCLLSHCFSLCPSVCLSSVLTRSQQQKNISNFCCARDRDTNPASGVDHRSE